MYLVINNSLTDITTVELPCDAEIYTLSGNGDIRSRVMYLNGEPLQITENGELPKLSGKKQEAGIATLAPGTCTFIVA